MSKFNALYKTLAENLPVNPANQNQQAPAQTQPAATNNQTTNNQQPAANTQQKIDVNNPVIKELVAAKDPNQVLLALQKLGLK